MHDALRITEIISEILSPQSMNDLASCARVCRCWFHPAIAILWKTGQLLPNLITVSASQGLLAPWHHSTPSQYMNFTRDPTEKDWSRIYFYLANIKILVQTTPFINNLSESSRVTWLRGCGRPLFPGVQRFLVSSYEARDVQFLGRLFQHFTQLRTFHILMQANTYPIEDLNGLWASLGSASRTLVKLWISRTEANLDEQRSHTNLCSTVRLLTNLEHFYFRGHALTPELCGALGSLPYLKSLRGYYNDQTDPTPEQSPEYAIADIFPELEEWETLIWAPFCGVVNASWFPPKKLQHFDGAIEGGEFRQLIEKFFFRKSPVQTLRVRVSADHLPPFLDFALLRHLRKLVISFTKITSLRDGDVEAITTALHQLEELALYSSGYHSMPTLMAIYYATAHCSNITAISMPLDTTYIPSPPETPVPSASLPSNSPPEPPLLLIHPFSTKACDPASIAEWIARHCHSPARIHFDSVQEDWLKVEVTLLQKFRSNTSPSIIHT